jgi:hypothetical protein
MHLYACDMVQGLHLNWFAADVLKLLGSFSCCAWLLQVQAGVLTLERRAADAASNTARGGWGSTAARHEPAVSEQDLAEMQQAVAKMHDKYGALLKEFLTGLPAAANEVSEGCGSAAWLCCAEAMNAELFEVRPWKSPSTSCTQYTARAGQLHCSTSGCRRVVEDNHASVLICTLDCCCGTATCQHLGCGLQLAC